MLSVAPHGIDNNPTFAPEPATLSLHDALPISTVPELVSVRALPIVVVPVEVFVRVPRLLNVATPAPWYTSVKSARILKLAPASLISVTANPEFRMPVPVHCTVPRLSHVRYSCL